MSCWNFFIGDRLDPIRFCLKSCYECVNNVLEFVKGDYKKILCQPNTLEHEYCVKCASISSRIG